MTELERRDRVLSPPLPSLRPPRPSDRSGVPLLRRCLRADVSRERAAAGPVRAPSLPRSSGTFERRPRRRCAVTREGRVFCWAADAYGELGTPPQTDGAPATSVEPLLVRGL